ALPGRAPCAGVLAPARAGAGGFRAGPGRLPPADRPALPASPVGHGHGGRHRSAADLAARAGRAIAVAQCGDPRTAGASAAVVAVPVLAPRSGRRSGVALVAEPGAGGAVMYRNNGTQADIRATFTVIAVRTRRFPRWSICPRRSRTVRLPGSLNATFRPRPVAFF